MAGHPSGDASVNREHIEKQRKGDQELGQKSSTSGARDSAKQPRTPDPEERARANEQRRR
jgi:hypothetical protein